MIRFIIIMMFCPTLILGSEPIYCRYVDQVSDQHANFMRAKGFRPSMSGGAFMYDIKEVDLAFSSSAAPDIKEARSLYVAAVTNLLRLINTNGQIQPYLHDKPFTLKNLDYRLIFKKIPFDQNRESVAFVYCSNRGEVYYDAFDPSQRFSYYRTIHHESFEEALRIVRESESLSIVSEI